jgi:hypothetical protein
MLSEMTHASPPAFLASAGGSPPASAIAAPRDAGGSHHTPLSRSHTSRARLLLPGMEGCKVRY